MPNLTIGPMVAGPAKHGVTAPIDVHLMVSPVDRIVQDADAGPRTSVPPRGVSPCVVRRPLFNVASMAWGVTRAKRRSTARSSSSARRAARAASSSTPRRPRHPKYRGQGRHHPPMSVNPGFGGQAFIPATLDKAREARKMIDESGYDIRLEIDGGVSGANIKEVAEAGVDMFVAGSAIFRDPRTEEAYKKTIDGMRAELAAEPPANKVAA